MSLIFKFYIGQAKYNFSNILSNLKNLLGAWGRELGGRPARV
jgi:hypothetical protein